MADRLAEIEGLRKSVDRRGLYGVHLETEVRVTTGLARGLLAVVDAARLLDPDYTLRCLLPKRTPVRNGVFRNYDCGECVPCALRAALANLEGGAS